ncbi:glutathione gamma-glutamylcysteinyltransferase 1-like isoform X1 [Rhododendron vialii]|uniref:glutathione gamma-glutamylcysteinyltransferase 1-like isoform X1 n=1 Tax=Rhododendron vialii TaxID=182163 RepID=UPI00265EEA8F|nr:glutathione gamma-glutamylcysteinyltransferase 1-like isoform X1 [Rhododendron vialii]XP_058186691.1 glutathione gamma-glutamylcysteinyltransferase 1-like isoform X1 [Rhododendron vialii]XP_058186692.1 glutathione gamma-glutamylcysteinyltransferase 1-like isoform X1 [Rhododendron vialii]
MLADPDTIAAIEEKGITFDEFKVLCQKHADVSAFEASDSSLQHFTDQLAGDGHYSPVSAYHGGEDMALILDVAQHKYPFYWLPGKVLWEAMNELDGATCEKRGFMVLKVEADRRCNLSNTKKLKSVCALLGHQTKCVTVKLLRHSLHPYVSSPNTSSTSPSIHPCNPSLPPWIRVLVW